MKRSQFIVKTYPALLASIFLHFAIFSIFYKNDRPVLALQSKRILTKVRIIAAKPPAAQNPIGTRQAVKQPQTKTKTVVPPKPANLEPVHVEPSIPSPIKDSPREPSEITDQISESSNDTPVNDAGSSSQPESEETQSDANWSNVPLSQSKPTFPLNAQENGIEGWVLIMFDISSEGRPINLQILQSEPKGIFDFEAKKSIRSRRYKPYLENGIPAVKAAVKVKIVFTLNN